MENLKILPLVPTLGRVEPMSGYFVVQDRFILWDEVPADPT
jgi:hypothetical protein